MNGPIAVLAGTPVDTRMGVAYLEERGLPGVPFPLSRGPREQTAFQHAPAADKRRQALAVLRGAMAQGCRRAFVYCNSLSAAVDFPGLAEETGMRIVTPLDVYRRLALRYRALGVIAANAQGTLRHRESIAGGQSRPGSAGGLCAAGGAGRGGGDAAGGAGGTLPSGGAGSVVCRRRDGGAGAGLHALPLF